MDWSIHFNLLLDIYTVLLDALINFSILQIYQFLVDYYFNFKYSFAVTSIEI